MNKTEVPIITVFGESGTMIISDSARLHLDHRLKEEGMIKSAVFQCIIESL